VQLHTQVCVYECVYVCVSVWVCDYDGGGE
jgi:hypothetical protein